MRIIISGDNIECTATYVLHAEGLNKSDSVVRGRHRRWIYLVFLDLGRLVVLLFRRHVENPSSEYLSEERQKRKSCSWRVRCVGLEEVR